MSEATAVLKKADLRERVQQLRHVLLRTPSICTESARNPEDAVSL